MTLDAQRQNRTRRTFASYVWEIIKYAGVSGVAIGTAGLLIVAVQAIAEGDTPWAGFFLVIGLQLAFWPIVIGALFWFVGHAMLRDKD